MRARWSGNEAHQRRRGREDRESVGNSLTRGGDGREMANSHVEQWMIMMMTALYEKKHMYQQPILFLHINSYKNILNT